MADNEITEAQARTSYVTSLGYYLDSDAIQVEIAWQLKRIADASDEKKPTPVVIFNSGGHNPETKINNVINGLKKLENLDFAHI
jgi:hypothetical protein